MSPDYDDGFDYDNVALASEIALLDQHSNLVYPAAMSSAPAAFNLLLAHRMHPSNWPPQDLDQLHTTTVPHQRSLSQYQVLQEVQPVLDAMADDTWSDDTVNLARNILTNERKTRLLPQHTARALRSGMNNMEEVAPYHREQLDEDSFDTIRVNLRDSIGQSDDDVAGQ